MAARRSWAARGLSSGCHGTVFLHCMSMRANIGNTPSINRRGVLEAPACLICIGYHWESSELSGEVEKRLNSEMQY